MVSPILWREAVAISMLEFAPKRQSIAREQTTELMDLGRANAATASLMPARDSHITLRACP